MIRFIKALIITFLLLGVLIFIVFSNAIFTGTFDFFMLNILWDQWLVMSISIVVLVRFSWKLLEVISINRLLKSNETILLSTIDRSYSSIIKKRLSGVTKYFVLEQKIGDKNKISLIILRSEYLSYKDQIDEVLNQFILEFDKGDITPNRPHL